MARATTSKLAPGEHTAERSTPTLQADGTYRLVFSVRYRDGRRPERKEARGATKGEVRRRAKAKAEELIRTNGSVWRLSDPFVAYIDKVSRPMLERADLREMSAETYKRALRFLIGDCPKCRKRGERHQHGLDQHTLGSGTKPRAVEELFSEIARLHGASSAKSCRTVWNKYIAQSLLFDGLMDHNPVAGRRLVDLTGVKGPDRSRGGKALSRAEYDKTLKWLLTVDPTAWLVSHKKHGWIWRPDVQVSTFRAAIDITLLQMTTGLRQSEARGVDWTMVDISKGGVMHISVPKAVAKGGHPRVVLVLDERVKDHLLQRRDAQNGTGYIVGAPMDAMKLWDRQRCGAECRGLYERMAAELKVDLFLKSRSHLWRTTLRSFYAGKVSEAVLNSQFGHSSEVANLYYTDASDLSGLASAASIGANGSM